MRIGILKGEVEWRGQRSCRGGIGGKEMEESITRAITGTWKERTREK